MTVHTSVSITLFSPSPLRPHLQLPSTAVPPPLGLCSPLPPPPWLRRQPLPPSAGAGATTALAPSPSSAAIATRAPSPSIAAIRRRYSGSIAAAARRRGTTKITATARGEKPTAANPCATKAPLRLQLKRRQCPRDGDTQTAVVAAHDDNLNNGDLDDDPGREGGDHAAPNPCRRPNPREVVRLAKSGRGGYRAEVESSRRRRPRLAPTQTTTAVVGDDDLGKHS